MRIHLPLLLLALSVGFCSAKPAPDLEFIKNNGQWEQQVTFKTSLTGGGYAFLEDQGITFLFYESGKLHAHNHRNGPNPDIQEHVHAENDSVIKGHVYKLQWLGANSGAQISGEGARANYYNYFIGNDPAHWKSEVPAYATIRYKGLYAGIDATVSSEATTMKTEYIVHPKARVSDIQIRYSDVDAISITASGSLRIKTSVNVVEEMRPYAYQLIDGREVEVPCEYQLAGNILSFRVGESYDPDVELVIDPTLVFSTYSGSTADNWGSSATYDAAGNMYLAGIVLGGNYPTTSGAFQTSFAGGSGTNPCDIVITKFSSNGSAQLYSTYIGGSRNELVSSLYVTTANELIMLASTGSGNYPVSVGAYDPSFNGGTGVSAIRGTFSYPNGSDIVLTKFNTTGTALIGSTYFGGTKNDGLNTGSILNYNYGDDTRGDIAVDNSGNIYIASTTSSTDIPKTAGRVQPAYAGGPTDGLLACFNSNLSSLQWATYYGTPNQDACYSLKLDKSGNVLSCGGTNGTALTGTAGGLNPAFQGGGSDGFVVKINNTATTLMGATYLGTNLYDQAFLMDLDGNDNVYVLGQTLGFYPVTPGVYFNDKARQFIHKLNPSLNATIYSTVFGSASPNQILNISPTALLVDKCENVHAVGWGGAVNNSGNTYRMPVTSDAYKSSTDGSDFYLITLKRDATGILYGSYFGESGGDDHVDGGTSRFDKSGLVYQAVCASCDGSNNFPVTPGAYSSQNRSSNCNMAGFKFQFDLQAMQVNSVSFPASGGCAPLTGNFTYTSTKPAASFFWDFGDGTSSTAEFPSHTYMAPGNYTVRLIISNPGNCNPKDSATFVVNVITGSKPTASFTIDSTNKCTTRNIVFTNTATNGVTYLWDFGDGTTSASAAGTVNHTYAGNGVYTVKLVAYNNTLCTKADSVLKTISIQTSTASVSVSASATTICNGTNVVFTATPVNAGSPTSYQWYLNGNPVGTNSTTYNNSSLSNNDSVWVVMTTSGSCLVGSPATSNKVRITITSAITPAFAAIGPLCQNSTAPTLPGTSTNGINGTWSPASINTAAPGTTTYTFTPAGGQCAVNTTQNITVNPQVVPAFAAIGPLCQNSTAPALPGTSTNGINGSWSPASIGTATPGTTTYTFTPAGGQCAVNATQNITVNPQVVPAFAAIGPLCQNSTAPALPGTSTNGINGTWSPASIGTATPGTTTFTFTPAGGQCAINATQNITVNPQVVPAFAAIGPLCQNSTAPALPGTSTNGINGSWSPSTINTATLGTTTYTFTPAGGQCAVTATMDVSISTQVVPAFAAIGPLCQNSTAPALPGTSTNGINGSWSPASINTATAGSTTYTFTPSVGQCAVSTTQNITINPQVLPSFAAIGSLCQNSAAPALPGTSTNGINGTWSPASINTATPGTTTFTFTPAGGQCAVTTTQNVTVNPQVLPAFTAIGPLCQNSTAPALPGTSTNGINGSWSPATISTATPGSAVYTFTPTPGQCAITASQNIVTDPLVVPAFASVGPLCQNTVAPALPGTSTNGVSGSWSPSSINTATAGSTTYTFTPNVGQCAVAATQNITIDPQVVPSFVSIGPLCQNSAAPALPTASTNAISGTWSPSSINTAILGTTTYTFTPSPGQCAATVTQDIQVSNQVLPVFAAIGPLCQNSTAPSLPGTSTNGISGSWSPATIATGTAGTATYTFTPGPGSCAIPATQNITIDPQVVPAFAAIGPLCQNSAPSALPGVSSNGITGSWAPAAINTATPGTSTYTFNPAPGQCAVPSSQNIVVDPQLTPAFSSIGPLCQNSAAPALPGTSTNGIAGSWSPSSINTATAGATNYTFTPAPGQCAVTASQNITITQQLVPAFAPVGALCQNSPAPALAGVSSNGITGSWSPAAISTSTAGSSTYTFTPVSGQCAVAVSQDVLINPLFTTNLSQSICQGDTYIVGGQSFNTGGNYTVRLQSVSGCDSTVILNLAVNPVKSTNIRQTICQGQSVTVGGQSFPNSGTYVVRLASSQGCDSTVTLDLTVNPQLLVEVDATSTKDDICSGDLVTFTAAPINGGSAPQYQWYLNTTPVGTNSPVYTNAGLQDGDSVWVSLVSSETCVQVNPAFSEPVRMHVSRIDYTIPAVVYCAGSSAVLDLQIPQDNYTVIWKQGAAIQSTTNDDAISLADTVSGRVQFTVSFGNNCQVSDSVSFTVNRLPEFEALADRYLVKYGDSVQLGITSTEPYRYQWTAQAQLNNDTLSDPLAIITNPVIFRVTATNDQGCQSQRTLFVDMTDECLEDFVLVPSGFTPNHDGLNDCFGPMYLPPHTEYRLEVFNRWGERIFEASNTDTCWDGWYKGREALTDGYTYVIGFRCYNGKFIQKSGVITLIR